MACIRRQSKSERCAIDDTTMESIYGGWLRKSPPEKRIWRGKWRRRWFVLRPSGHIPGQFVLDYFTDETCKKLKGHIDLDQCEQIDTGLPPSETNRYNYGHVFDIRTPKRIYYLVADKEEEMNKWVDSICSVCGFKIHVDDFPTSPSTPEPSPDVIRQQPSPVTPDTPDVTSSRAETQSLASVSTCSPSGPYIAISDCITGTSPFMNGYGDDKDDVFPDQVPPPPPKGGERSKTLSGDFYDYPRQINPLGLDSALKPYTDGNHDAEGDDSGWPTMVPNPPKVNWETYPRGMESEGNHVLTDNHHQTTTMMTDTGDVTGTLRRLCLSDPDGSMSARALSIPPPRPPKPKPTHLLGTSRLTGGSQQWNGLESRPLNHNNYDNIANCDLSSLYDVPPSAQGVFLSKNLPANAFAYLRDDSIDIDQVPGAPGGPYQVDEMYDFPRPLHDDQLNATPPAPSGESIWHRRHGYTNAPALLIIDGEGSGHSTNNHGKDYLSMDPNQHFVADVYTDMSGEGRSPTSLYSNIPSPMHRNDSEMGIAVPPTVNRELKPRRKLESISGKPQQTHQPEHLGSEAVAYSLGADEKSSPAHAPQVDRRLKPQRISEGLVGSHSPHTPVMLAPPYTVISKNPPRGKRSFRKPRVQPSPNPSSPASRPFNNSSNGMLSPNCRSTDRSSSDDDQSSSCSSRRNSSNDDHIGTKQVYVYGKSPSPSSSAFSRRKKKEIQYLDLDLDSDGTVIAQSPKSPEKPSSNTVYKTVDFVKTKAFNDMRQDVEASYRKSQ